MINGKENVIKFLEINETPKWRVKRSENSNPIFSQDDKNFTMRDSIDRLRKGFEMLKPGTYFIEASNGDDRRNWVKESFEIGYENHPGSININGVAAAQPINEDEIKRKAVQDYQKEVELKELRERVAELESPLNKAIGKLEPFIPHLIGAIFPNAANAQPMAGQGGVNGVELQDEITIRAQKALEDWYALDPQAIDILEAIPGYIKSNKAMYEMLKSQLLK